MLTDSGLAGKAVIVTGGSRGIGRAIVEMLSSEGADVSFLFREDTAAAAEVVATGQTTGRPITAEQVDVRDAQACALAVERIAERCRAHRRADQRRGGGPRRPAGVPR